MLVDCHLLNELRLTNESREIEGVRRWRKGNNSSVHAKTEESLSSLCSPWKMGTIRQSSSFRRKFVLFVSVFPTGAFVCDKQKV